MNGCWIIKHIKLYAVGQKLEIIQYFQFEIKWVKCSFAPDLICAFFFLYFYICDIHKFFCVYEFYLRLSQMHIVTQSEKVSNILK